MSFTLRIAAARDRSIPEASARDRVEAPSAPVATIIANGRMDVPELRRLVDEWRRLFAEGADTIVVEFGEVTFASTDVRTGFTEAVLEERCLQHHVFVRALAPALHDSLIASNGAGGWLMPLDGSQCDAPRRSIMPASPLDPRPLAP